MKIYKLYFGEKEPEKITMEHAIERLEEHGYYAPGTVAEMLKNGEKLRTNAAIYYATPE